MRIVGPATIPVLQRVPVTTGGEIGLVAIDVLDGAWTLDATFPSTLPDHRARREWSAHDDAGTAYPGRGGGGSSDRFQFNFEPAIDPAARVLTIELTVGDVEVTADVPLAAPARGGVARLLRVESWPSARWEQRWKPEHRPLIDAWFHGFPGRTIPERVIALNTVAGEVATRDLAFLSAERWGRTWVLRHHAVTDEPTYSPLLCHWLELEFDGGAVPALGFGGGTAGSGFTYGHMFLADAFPSRMRVRRPATDGGPPLVEIDLELA